MDLPYEASRITGSNEQITVWDAKRLNSIRSNPLSMYLYQAIDAMGVGSKVAQGINAALTSVERLKGNPQHRLYLLCVDRQCVGILKVGPKKLFIRRYNGSLTEMEPLCVLDFYVHEAEQRSGFGKVLFEFMLEQERVDPRHLAIDRPSPKFLGFLRKHYRLSDFVPQTNNFVVFNQYFDDTPPSPHAAAPPKVSSTIPPPLSAALQSSRTSSHSPPHLLEGGLSSSQPSKQPPATFGTNIASNIPVRMPTTTADSFDMMKSRVVGSRELGASHGRRSSPTRSGAQGYNIITLTEERGNVAPLGSAGLRGRR